jgi:hypothetical protein
MDKVDTILNALDQASKVPGLLALVVSAGVILAVGVCSGTAFVVWWARGVVTWKEYTAERKAMADQMEADRALVAQAISTLRNDMNKRIEHAEEVIQTNSRDAIVEARDAVKRVEEHASKFESVVDKVMDVVGKLQVQVISLAAVIAAKLP